MKLFKKIIEKAKPTQKLLAVRVEKGESRMYLGQVIAYNDELLILNAFNKYGHFDGQVILEFEHVEAIEFDDTFLRKVQHWIDYKAQIYEQNPTPSFLDSTLKDYEVILKKAKEVHKLIDFHLSTGVEGFGYILEVEESQFMVRLYNNYGEYEGFAVYEIFDLDTIKWDTPELRAVELMIDQQQSLGNGR